MEWMSQISETYSQLWKMIIRPGRSDYDLSDLGPTKFRVAGRLCRRSDFDLLSGRSQRLRCSHFLPGAEEHCGAGGCSRLPCVVYCHGNCSSRIEALEVVPVLLSRGISVFCLDFSGSGLSDGDYISLGYFEQLDLRDAIDHLRGPGGASSVALWGRSMGGSTNVLRASSDPLLAACVIDSAFGSLRKVIEELAEGGGIGIPGFLLSIAIQVVRREVHARANFDIDELSPLDGAAYAVSPALFATATDDMLVLPHHSQDLHDAWGGERELVTFEGGHSGQRPGWFLEQCANFLEINLKKTCDRNRTLVPAQVPRPLPQPRVDSTRLSASSASARPPSIARSGLANEAAAAEMRAMGFGDEAIAEALQRNSSKDAAVEWILRSAAESMRSKGGLEFRPPTTLRHIQRDDTSADTPERVFNVASEVMPSPTQPQISINIATVARELEGLGVAPLRAAEAARRCSSVEAAVDWLVARGEL